MKLRSYLILLVTAAVLPAVLFAGILTYLEHQRERAAQERGLIDRAEALSLALDRELSSSIRVLEALAASAYLDAGDLSRFHIYATRVLKIHHWESILLLDPSNQELVNTRFPFGAPLPRGGNPELISTVVKTMRAVVSRLFIGGATKQPLVAIAVPVVRDGRSKYVVASSVSPATLANLISQQKLPSGWLATIIDANKTIISRTQNLDKFLGRSAPPHFVAMTKEAEHGLFHGVTLDGIPVATGFSRSKLSGWTVGIAIPLALLDAPLNLSLIQMMIGGMLFLLLGTGFAVFIGRRITSSYRELARAAAAVGQGEIPKGAPSPIIEANELARALENAAAHRKTAEQEIRRLAKFPAENPNPVLRVDQDGVLLYANDASRMLLMDWRCSVGGRVPDVWHDLVSQALLSGEHKNLDVACGRNLYSLIIGPVPASGYANLYGDDITERNRAEQELTKSTERLRALSARLQRIREEERTLMAREIHDQLGQALTAIKMDLASLVALAPKSKEITEKAGEMAQLVDETVQTVRRIASNLRPGILDDLGLVPALQWQAQEFYKRTGIQCDLISELNSISLVRDQTTTLFRICQEALTNVIRHAEATLVKITLRTNEDDLLMQVQDNGRGFTAGELTDPKALGLLGMQERAKIVRGSCNISGERGKGTIVTVQIPLRKQA